MDKLKATVVMLLLSFSVHAAGRLSAGGAKWSVTAIKEVNDSLTIMPVNNLLVSRDALLKHQFINSNLFWVEEQRVNSTVNYFALQSRQDIQLRVFGLSQEKLGAQLVLEDKQLSTKWKKLSVGEDDGGTELTVRVRKLKNRYSAYSKGSYMFTQTIIARFRTLWILDDGKQDPDIVA
ncbi:hypothetical protein [Dongshaea marina]|uniref:hypothetical protein n=1 Tax=Dongshaea marina TaxID=2047966 RepID=UPI000D3EC4EE|nr:hypothetical protein [Dongshaea marina]